LTHAFAPLSSIFFVLAASRLCRLQTASTAICPRSAQKKSRNSLIIIKIDVYFCAAVLSGNTATTDALPIQFFNKLLRANPWVNARDGSEKAEDRIKDSAFLVRRAAGLLFPHANALWDPRMCKSPARLAGLFDNVQQGSSSAPLSEHSGRQPEHQFRDEEHHDHGQNLQEHERDDPFVDVHNCHLRRRYTLEIKQGKPNWRRKE
jgi:hypothetical protein